MIVHAISLSGGKDSVATMVLLAADTGHEHPITYDYWKYLEDRLQMPIQPVLWRKRHKPIRRAAWVALFGVIIFGAAELCELAGLPVIAPASAGFMAGTKGAAIENFDPEIPKGSGDFYLWDDRRFGVSGYGVPNAIVAQINDPMAGVQPRNGLSLGGNLLVDAEDWRYDEQSTTRSTPKKSRGWRVALDRHPHSARNRTDSMTTDPDTSAKMATIESLIDAEAKRLCVEAGYGLDYIACQDRRFRHDDRRPWWQAMLCHQIQSDIERLEKAGFVVAARITASLAEAEGRAATYRSALEDIKALVVHHDKYAPFYLESLFGDP